MPSLSPEPVNHNPDLKRIFISREHELDLFDVYLTRWKRQIQQAGSGADTALQAVPSPNNQLQNLIQSSGCGRGHWAE